YHKADICKKDEMRSLFDKARPQVVIHTAGAASVDYCERNYDVARNSNVFGTQVITELCREYGSEMAFISTNAVFDGKSAPYSEDDKPSPINKYGEMKLEGEKIVRESGLKHLIVRPILMYGWNNKNERSNPVTWLIQKLGRGEGVKMVNDVFENPLLNTSCAEIIWALIRSGKEGLYHIAGKDILNRYEFALLVADIFGLNRALISSVSSAAFKDLAPRPSNTSYNTAKIERELKIKLLTVKEGLELMKKSAQG
ncbi:MAG: SDR family oxidoreductase, partial [Candidatus Omnitrophica bacterium]|nr:SDR family oxidoreductase [Candidatus Omnitrophota bacterium]